MAEKRQRRRLDTRPQNRADVKAGVTKAHLNMRGEAIGGTLATGEKAGTKDPEHASRAKLHIGGDVGIKSKDMSLEGFYQRNPHVKRGEFDPDQASGHVDVKRRLKAKRDAAPPPLPPHPVGTNPEQKPPPPPKAAAPAAAPAEKVPAPQQPPPEPDPVPGKNVDPNAPGGGGGGDPVQGAQPGLNPLTAGEGPSRQGARAREAQATGPQARILKNEQGVITAGDQLAAVQLKEAELNRAMVEQKARQSRMSRRSSKVQEGPRMTPKTGR